mmetsp:Transcript_9201/g.25732  ORF Transcript_9201/g.25732 Transcript_9201/m.25732 type:complete len:458 (-) Transcript_9201:30-1403(-)
MGCCWPCQRRALTAASELPGVRGPGRRNVQAVLVSNFFCAVGMSMWQGQLLSIFLFDMVIGDTKQIGFIEGCQGMAQLVAGFAAGWAVDVLGATHRNLLLKLSTLYSVVVLGFCGYCVLCLREPWAWYLCCCLFAPAVSAQRSIVECLFADSVPTGARVKDYTMKRIWQLVGQLMGPLLQALIFTFSPVEDAWTRQNLTVLMLGGIAATIAGCIAQLAMDQRDTLGMQSEAVQVQTQNEAQQDSPLAEAPAGTPLDSPTNGEHAGAAALERTALVVRWAILVYDVVRVTFGGLAVKYYGLYFTQAFGMPPVKFMWLQAVTMLSMAAFVQLGGRLCRAGCPRTQVCFAFLLLNNTGNFIIGYGPLVYDAAIGWVLREGALNGMFHLKQSVLMDHTPKKQRGIWNSVDSLNSSFWSGSALVGGWLVEMYGYRTNFLVMGWGFILASLAWTVLLVRAGKT